MIVDPGFLDHWKTRLLIRLTGSESAPLMVLRLWAHCQRRKSDRFALSDEALAAICQWQGDASQLRAILADCGFIDRGDDGEEVIVHGWLEANRSLMSAWENGRKAAKQPDRHTDRYTGRLPVGSRTDTGRNLNLNLNLNPNLNSSTYSTRKSTCTSTGTSTSRNGTKAVTEPVEQVITQLPSELVAAKFREWMQFRLGLGKKPKDWVKLFTEQVQWLSHFPEHEQIEILSQSIRNGWQGLFEPASRRSGKAAIHQEESRAEREWREMIERRKRERQTTST